MSFEQVEVFASISQKPEEVGEWRVKRHYSDGDDDWERR